MINSFCVASVKIYLDLLPVSSSKSGGDEYLQFNWGNAGGASSEWVYGGGMGRLMKDPGSDQRRENEMAFDLVGCWQVALCHRSAKQFGKM